MEVETQAFSTFHLNPVPFPSPPTTVTDAPAVVDQPEAHARIFQTSEMLGSPDSPQGGGLLSAMSGIREWQVLVDRDRVAPTFDSTSPATINGEFEVPLFLGEAIPADRLEKCPSNAAKKVQKVYRSYRTRRMLADSAVVAEELWWQALDYARLNHSTISFFNFLKPETAASRWNRVGSNAAIVGKGLSKDDKAQKLAFQHWIEAIDPRHRYGHSLHKYYEVWCKADAGQPFFYWLDLGDGKDVDLKDCPRSQLRHQCIKYLGPQERENYEYMIVEGKIVHKQTGNLLDTRKGPSGAKWIFVMSTSKRLYAGEKKKGNFHHSSFLAGGATLAAGRMVVEDGIVKSISAYSGHYRPTDDRLGSFLQFLKDSGVSLDDVEIRKANEDYEFEDGKSNKDVSTSDVPSVSHETNHSNDEEKTMSLEAIEIPQFEASPVYQRTLSGGLQSPRAEIPRNVILQRINSKKAAQSYQLGHQLSLKWSTGAGPRIGCVADYPIELRLQALELTNLSPRTSPMPFTPRQGSALISPPYSASQPCS